MFTLASVKYIHGFTITSMYKYCKSSSCKKWLSGRFLVLSVLTHWPQNTNMQSQGLYCDIRCPMIAGNGSIWMKKKT